MNHVQHQSAKSANLGVHIPSAGLGTMAMMLAKPVQGGGKNDVRTAVKDGHLDDGAKMVGLGHDVLDFGTTEKAPLAAASSQMFANAGRPARAMSGACYQ